MTTSVTTETLANGRTYTHRTAAHCETGVTSALFFDKGLNLSEPMIFGIGSGIFSAICRSSNGQGCPSLPSGQCRDWFSRKRPKD